jgi:long-chain acyl-CoA synthetase
MDSVDKRLTGPGSPFELTERIQDGVAIRVFSRAPARLTDVFNKARSFGQRPFLVSGAAQLSYAEVFDHADTFARGLQALFGIGKGSRVAIVMENRLEWPIAFIALCKLCAVPVAVNHRAKIEEIAAALKSADCALVITDNSSAEGLAEHGELRPRVVVRSQPAQALPDRGETSYEQVLGAGNASPPAPFEQVEPQETALIAFTSGTTGRAKGALFSQQSIVTGLMNMLLGGALIASASNARGPRQAAQPKSTATASSLLISPFSHIGGYAQLLLMPFIGGKIVLLPAWDLQLACTLIEREKIRSLSGATPAMIRALLNASRSGCDVSSLATFNVHGAALQANLVEEINATLAHATVWTGYGMTETNGSVCVASGSDLLERPTTCGRRIPSVDLKIASADGAALGTASIGEIWVRGAMLMREYCAAPDATAQVLRDGWFRTADLGRIDSGGFLHIIDRMKDVIATDAGEVSYAQVERALASHSEVEEAAVAGFDDQDAVPRLTVAVVVRAPGTVTAHELREYVGARLPPLRRLHVQAVICGALPRNAAGKINRQELRRRLAAG